MDYASLVPAQGTDGAVRKVGVEIEFGGLGETHVARIVVDVLGGEIDHTGPHEYRVRGTSIGGIKVLLDTALRDKADNPVAEWGLNVSRAVVPVEIVTEPLDPADLPQLDTLLARLRGAGALGTKDGMLLGFGTHLNPSLAGEDAGHILPTLRAFALLEDWLREAEPIDASRRVLPFVDPYPRRLVDALAEEAAADWTLDRMIAAYLGLAPSRNHALDLLPVLRHLDEDRVVAALGSDAQSVSGRPAFHYRLPDSRIDEEGWSLAPTWNRWCLIERVAADHGFVADLAAAFCAHRASLTTLRGDWARQSGEMLTGWRARTEAA
ncbi:amidoligase family protein [Anianabacter salinae]|uniref:amidoligase family protein n=1 Tax=Anianabacter salinae TaxID=2851023 RepID=UPI00225E6D9C|nr:amidoligase family protein [Anianabacter salinae]MBV0913688.1 amidoligase family protein [Anianabacter salinae]